MAYSWGWSSKKFWKSDIEYFFKTWVGKHQATERDERREYIRGRKVAQWILTPYMKNVGPNWWKLHWDKARTEKEFLEEHKDKIPIWDKLAKGTFIPDKQ